MQCSCVKLYKDNCNLVECVENTAWTMLAVLWGCSVPWGDILSTVGDVQYRGGYHDKCGIILSTVRDTQYRGGYHDARGEYHEYRGGVHPVLWRENLLLFEHPHGTEHPHSTHHIPHMYLDIPTVLKLQRMVSPHSTPDIPHGTQDIPTFIMVPPRY